MRIEAGELCVACDHRLDVHTHYRSGTDCGLCPCDGFVRMVLPWRVRALVWLDHTVERFTRRR